MVCENMQEATLRTYVKMYNESVETRLRSANRLKHYPNNDVIKATIKEHNKNYRKNEKILKQNIEDFIEMRDKYDPIYQWLISHRGISVVLAGGIIAYIDDISKFPTVSHLWSYAGYAPMEYCQTCKKEHIQYDKKADHMIKLAARLKEQNDKSKDPTKKKKGEDFLKSASKMICQCDNPDIKVISQKRIAGGLIHHNPDFKKLCYLIGDQFIKQTESPYRQFYLDKKNELIERPDLKAEIKSKKKEGVSGTAHVHALARRIMIKLFLQHVWQVWREIEGLPTPTPYVFDIMGHTHKIEPYSQLE
jgi:hypothetical protein